MELPFIRYTITSNGAVITDRDGNKTIRERCMSKETARKVLDAADEKGIIREYFAGGYGYHDAESHELLWHRFTKTPVLGYLEQSRRQVEDLYQSLAASTQEIENISIMCSSYRERMSVLRKIEKIAGIGIIYPWPTDLEIIASDADKGEALLWLAELLGLRREEVMAVGDSNNDLGLMEAAGFSVAMGNSMPEILKAADYVTFDNEHDGVAEAIRKCVLGKGEQGCTGQF